MDVKYEYADVLPLCTEAAMPTGSFPIRKGFPIRSSGGRSNMAMDGINFFIDVKVEIHTYPCGLHTGFWNREG